MATNPDFLRGQTPFRSLLQAYKAEGCAILVVGDVPDHVLDLASAQLLGDPSASPRERVFGLFDRTLHTVRDRLDHAGYGQTPTRVVTTADQPRTSTASATATPDGGTHAPDTPDSPGASERANESLDVHRVDGDALPAVADALSNAMTPSDANADADADGYGPAELRVCIDSLRPVLDTYDDPAVDAFLDAATTTITDHHGMGHAVLPAAADAPAVDQVRDHFDIVLPLRSRNGTPEQRWEFTAENRVLDWHPL